MAQKTREEVDAQYKWDLTPLYASTEEWRKAKDALQKRLAEIRNYKGRLAESASTLLSYMRLSDSLDKEMSRLYLYASLLSDEDVSNADNMALTKEMEQVGIEYDQQADFARPELSAISDITYDKYMAEAPGLLDYRMDIDAIRRQRPHTLSEEEEAVLSKMSLMGDTPTCAYNIFSDAEMPRPRITLADGTEAELDHSTYGVIRASANRTDRQTAFEAFWSNYKHFEGTFGELMGGKVREALFSAKVRKYESTLNASLSRNKIPEAVYHSLIDNVNRNLPTFHRYLRLKKRLLGVDELHY